MNYRMQLCQSIGEIAQDDWNSLLLASGENTLHPALRHEYLHALETSGSATEDTGWAPLHVRIDDENGKLAAAMPLYLKSHSYGEYVFDWSWAQAYERHGLPYYPKLLCAVPFTPVLGPKLLYAEPHAGKALLEGFSQLAQKASQSRDFLGVQISTAHCLFLTERDEALLRGESSSLNFMPRHVVQFHWENKHPDTGLNFEDFEHWLESLQQKKRKNIRAERRKAHVEGVQITRHCGADIAIEDLEYFYRCYVQTYAEHHSTPYLSLAFFKSLIQNMGEQVLLVMARIHGKPAASSFFLFNQNRLYGRYWGASQRIDCMHFELCYYQAIEFAIERKIQWFEGGAQGEHKMARGLNPVTMHSAHWVANPEFEQAISRFLERERNGLQAYEGELSEHIAYKKQQALE